MKRMKVFFTCVAVMGLVFAVSTALAQDVVINATNFPDATFRDTYVWRFDTDKNGVLKQSEIDRIVSLNVSDVSITDLKGIEYFTNLKELDCSGNELKTLDVSKNTKLIELDCSLNKLTSLDVSTNIKLKQLNCSWNKLTKIDVSGCASLEELVCEDNILTNLDVSRCAGLELLECDNNKLTKLDVSGCIDLNEIICYGNTLTSLDVSKNTKLESLSCSSNKLTSLDVSKNTKLELLYCDANRLTSLDVSKNTDLEYLRCTSNKLTSLDVTQNTELRYLDCSSNKLTSLNVSKNTKLTKSELKFDNNKLTTKSKDGYIHYSSLPGFDISKASNIQGAKIGKTALILTSKTVKYDYDLGQKGWTATFTLKVSSVADVAKINTRNFPNKTFREYVKQFDLTGNGALNQAELDQVTEIDVAGKKIANLKGIAYFTSLTSLNCGNNKLTSLDVSKNTKLTGLWCGNNKIKSLNVSNNTNLVNLHCGNNALTKLDVSSNTKLTTLNCESNKLNSLNVSKNTKLKSLSCGGNHLTSLDISKNTKLTMLDCLGNTLTVTPKDGKILYSSLPGLVSSKVVKSSVQGAKKGTTAFLVEDGATEVTYDYKINKTKKVTFKLLINGSEKKSETQSKVKNTAGELKSIKLNKIKYTYTGKAIEPKVTVKGSKTGKTVTLKKGTDYTVTYENNVNAGTATVMVKGKGNYTGTLTATFTIEPLKMKNATVKLDKTTVPYTGKALKPTVTVKMKLNGKTVTLRAGTDYTVKYSNNKKPGTATVIITGKGNFTGTINLTFKIVKK